MLLTIKRLAEAAEKEVAKPAVQWPQHPGVSGRSDHATVKARCGRKPGQP
jgi:hypothetical protein